MNATAEQVEPQAALVLPRAAHVPVGMAPRTMEEGMKLSNTLAKSTLVPKDFIAHPANIFIALQWGAELGLAPMQALQSIAVINGRPSIFGDGLLAVVMGSGLLEWIDEPPVEDGEASCTVQRKGWPKPVTRTFSMEDAQTAGLAGKSGPWKTYPKRMLQMRARGFALRDTFADVLRGVISAEEAEDIPPEKQVNDQISDMPRRKSAAPTPDDPPADPKTGEIIEDEPVAQEATQPNPKPRTVRPLPAKEAPAPQDAAAPEQPTHVEAGEPLIEEGMRRKILGAARKQGRNIQAVKAHLLAAYELDSTKHIPARLGQEILDWASSREPGEDDD